MPTVTALDHLVLTVADIEATIAFYRDAMGMSPQTFLADGGTRHALIFGKQKINLHLAGHEFEPKAIDPTPGSGDLCFLSGTPLDDWISHLETLGVPVETGPVPRTGATGVLTSIYVRDPDGNLIEIANEA